MIMNELEKNQAVQWLQDMVRFKTISGEGPTNGDYVRCANWLLEISTSIGLEANILEESKEGKPIVVVKWSGSDTTLSVVILNSHYDVVPVVAEYWTEPSFDGLIKDGKLYGRGTQDMKSVCVQYLVSIQKLRRSGFIPKRSILLTFVPDEEIGGVDGMRVLLGSRAFADVHKQGIAIALDEGLATEGDSYPLFYGERLPWWVSVTGVGNTGHASRFIEGTAVEQILSFAQKALDYRQEQKRLLHGGADDHENCSHSVAAKRIRTDKLSLGDVTTLNITSLHASVMAGGEDVLNVVPPSATLKLDIRISPHTKPTDITDKLDQWCRECSSVPGLPAHGGLSWSIISKQALMEHQTTSLGVTPFDSDGTVSQNVPADDEKANEVRENQEWLSVIRETLQSKFNSDVTPMVFPAATDSRFLRALGIRAFGFSPIRRSPVLLHEHDEFIPIDVYLEGCEVYIQLIQAISTHP